MADLQAAVHVGDPGLADAGNDAIDLMDVDVINAADKHSHSCFATSCSRSGCTLAPHVCAVAELPKYLCFLCYPCICGVLH